MLRFSLTSVLVAWLWLAAASVAFAQPVPAPQSRAALADVWLSDAVHAELNLDTFDRYVAAPLAGMFGGFLLVATPFAKLNPVSTVTFTTGGALLLTAATGVWTAADPGTSQRWYSRWSSLGFVSLGIGVMISSASHDLGDEGHVFARRLSFAAGATDVVTFLSLFVLSVLTPPESPAALQLSLRGTAPEARYDRVLEFLRQRSKQQRTASLVLAPWSMALGVAAMALSPEAATSGGRALTLGLGIGVVAWTAFSVIYELAHTQDWERFQAGESP
jgi:hypothetical protein